MQPDGVVECKLICKQRTVIFQFISGKASGSDICQSLINEKMLPEEGQQYESVLFQLNNVLEQLAQDPSRVPICAVDSQNQVIFNPIFKTLRSRRHSISQNRIISRQNVLYFQKIETIFQIGSSL